jgi:putative transcriptional regulator
MAEHSLAPGLLLAMPQMTDPNFARSVVLLCRHESDGAMGLVVNRPTDMLVASVVQFDPPLTEDRAGLRVWTGGPVEQQRAWLLLGFDPGEDDALPIAPGLYLSASARVLRHILEGGDEDRVREARFLVGYAGWAGGQLESELAASAWLTADVSKDLIFHTDAEVMWEAAIRSLGIDPYALQLGTGVH